ncbi:MAG TPA: glucose 1-dehydrogenase [Acidimicrobiales bacterium]|jgi:NAD(P)-dependent dehydrogenase (short-subunit alcohol dehydrogenase family)|nr:glucose 1-dehydrogenase [Acidimicrobiales bacterium]
MAGLAAGKVVLVTGAASGMGRAGVHLFAREGATHVYAADRDEGGVIAAVAELHRAGADATAVPLDVTDERAVAALVDDIVGVHGRLDAAWNNAGIGDVSRPFHELDIDAWNRMIAVNLTSVFVCMKHEIRQMLDHGGGAIVNTSSGAGIVAAPGMPHYTAAKHGVLGLTKSAASEYNDRSIRVNALCPGMVDTAMIQGWFETNPELASAVLKTMPGGKLGTPEQVAEAAVWLCSDAASWVSGLSMVIDGGGVNR